MSFVSTVNETLRIHRDEIARMQNQIGQLVGYLYPSRGLVEFALYTQLGDNIDIPRAHKHYYAKLK
ncbi:MAG TPA: hypothetical protein VIE69_06955 [Methylophilaceae bacterium]